FATRRAAEMAAQDRLAGRGQSRGFDNQIHVQAADDRNHFGPADFFTASMSGQTSLVITVALYGRCRTLATRSASGANPSWLSRRGLHCPPDAPQSTNDFTGRWDCVAAKRSLRHASAMIVCPRRALIGSC